MVTSSLSKRETGLGFGFAPSPPLSLLSRPILFFCHFLFFFWEGGVEFFFGGGGEGRGGGNTRLNATSGSACTKLTICILPRIDMLLISLGSLAFFFHKPSGLHGLHVQRVL